MRRTCSVARVWASTGRMLGEEASTMTVGSWDLGWVLGSRLGPGIPAGLCALAVEEHARDVRLGLLALFKWLRD